MLIFRKIILALTGLFICLFITVHLGGNLILVFPERLARPIYNAYSEALGSNPFIMIIAYLNYACFAFHIVYGTILTILNRRSRTSSYNKRDNHSVTNWSSQNMGLLGALLFAFIVIHMANFWFRVKFTDDERDMYTMVSQLFHNPFYAAFYSLAMIPLGLHLSHGVSSAFRSLGLYNQRYLKWVANIGVAYAAIVSTGFAIIPIIMYMRASL